MSKGSVLDLNQHLKRMQMEKWTEDASPLFLVRAVSLI